jgi:hypothetical protein
MPFEIPPEHNAAVAKMVTMPKSSVDALITALKDVPLSSDTDDIAKRISPQLPAFTVNELESALDSLYDLYFIRELAGVPRSAFLDDFMEGLQNRSDFGVRTEDLPKLRNRFERLLNIESFNILSKAKRLQRNGERLYCDAKILSDVRPVFREKPTARPTEAVITHTLMLAYHEGGEHKELHVVLDRIDLELLKGVIDRAEAKDKTLRLFLKESNVSDLGV